MAKDTTQTPPAEQKVEIDLPAGMTKEQFLGLFGTFNKAVVKGKAIGRADGRAFRRLIAAHKEELLKFRIEEWKKEGLDPSKLHLKK